MHLAFALIPFGVVAVELWFMSQVRFDWQTGFWFRGTHFPHPLKLGGNSAEYYSHWLNMILVSGNALLLSWLCALDLWLSRSRKASGQIRLLIGIATLVAVLVCFVGAVILDRRNGEGVVSFLVPHFACLLVAGYVLLWCALKTIQRMWFGIAIAWAYAALHLMFQLLYEPSGSGAPNPRAFSACTAALVVLPTFLFVMRKASTQAVDDQG